MGGVVALGGGLRVRCPQACLPLGKSVGCRAWGPLEGTGLLAWGRAGAADPSDLLPVLPGAAALYLLSNPLPWAACCSVSPDLRQRPFPRQGRTGASAPGSE